MLALLASSLFSLFLAAGPAVIIEDSTATSTTVPVETGLDAGGTMLAAPGGYLMGPIMELYAGPFSIEMSADLLHYESAESGYQEWGDGMLFNFHGRLYFNTTRASGGWFGAGIAAGSVKVEWRERQYGGSWTWGADRNSIAVANFGVGYKMVFGGPGLRLTVDPQLLGGVVAGGGTPFVVGAGIGAGLRF